MAAILTHLPQAFHLPHFGLLQPVNLSSYLKTQLLHSQEMGDFPSRKRPGLSFIPSKDWESGRVDSRNHQRTIDQHPNLKQSNHQSPGLTVGAPAHALYLSLPWSAPEVQPAIFTAPERYVKTGQDPQPWTKPYATHAGVDRFLVEAHPSNPQPPKPPAPNPPTPPNPSKPPKTLPTPPNPSQPPKPATPPPNLPSHWIQGASTSGRSARAPTPQGPAPSTRGSSRASPQTAFA